MVITCGTMVLLRIHILRNIPITTITEVAMSKIKFVIEVVDTVIRVAQLIREELKNDSTDSLENVGSQESEIL
jgi:hypothetical protein